MSQSLDLFIFKKCPYPELSQFCLAYDPIDGLCLLDEENCKVVVENLRILVGKVSRLGPDQKGAKI